METNLLIARVHDIIYDESHHSYDRCGKHESIGSILFLDINSPTPTEEDTTLLPCAKPAFFSLTQYPLINEIVFIISTTAPTLSNEEIEGGASVSSDRELKLKFGNYFNEIEKIRPLRPYEGDIMVEGRYGNSIRLGATTYNQLNHNNRWSNEGEVGNPITIIRNGQIENKQEASYEHIIEDIDGDDSSIYLCSQQQLTNFTPSSNYQLSFGKDIDSKTSVEAERKNEGLSNNVEEDQISTAPTTIVDNELIVEEKIEDSETAYYDIAGTEIKILKPGDNINLPGSYIVPSGENLDDELG